MRQAAEKQLADLAAAEASARKAVEAGDMDAAAKELARLMAIDPTHPSVQELTGKLNSRFRGQAEDARTSMARSRAAAEKAGASSQRVFGEAVGLSNQGESLFHKSEFAASTQKFLEARDTFDRAGKAAETSRATKAPTAAAATAAPSTPAVVVNTAPPTAPPTSAPTAAPIDEEPAIKRVVADYVRALTTKDIALYRSVKPNLSADEQKNLEQSFRSIKSHEITISGTTVQVEGREATVRLSRQDKIDGKSFATQQTLLLTKTAAGWTIRQLK